MLEEWRECPNVFLIQSMFHGRLEYRIDERKCAPLPEVNRILGTSKSIRTYLGDSSNKTEKINKMTNRLYRVGLYLYLAV
jgi:hypothetical protein